ncbi:aminopeptidase [Bacillus sp. MUM 13]|uniref:aminopeptidase n=1 Tax=Bacillus sp. MUM 13 TaxID=1678001 RepID=UPI0008F5707E|nr:aminopeptidase [Bacillus sp. MUM 13]OIK11573.1 aminopeptidase [Bacillus sp. MUM 13]
MRDERLNRLAKMLLKHSIKLQKKQKVLIRGHVNSKPLLKELIDETYKMGGYPYVDLMDDEISRHLLMGYEKEQLDTFSSWMMKKYEDTDAVIIVYGEENDAEFSEVPAEKHRLRGEAMKPSTFFYVNNRKWVLLNYPTVGLAQKAGMSLSRFEDYLLDVCTVDYEKMEQAMQPLKELMEATDKVRIVSPGTDLSFSIKDIPAVICAGSNNVPDGEVFTAPVKESVNGTITFNTPCPYQGSVFRGVSLTFKEGKITDCTADQLEKLHAILDTDSGSRFIGEFALGVNPLITEPIGDILFDEKICGSLHFTPGEAYEEADNGNRSSIHWDMVLIQRPEYGGGEIYFDDVLVRKDGMFVLPQLAGLNPESLKW